MANNESKLFKEIFAEHLATGNTKEQIALKIIENAKNGDLKAFAVIRAVMEEYHLSLTPAS